MAATSIAACGIVTEIEDGTERDGGGPDSGLPDGSAGTPASGGAAGMGGSGGVAGNGGGSGGSSATGGSGGSAGAPVTCDKLTPVDAGGGAGPMLVAGEFSDDQRPRLVALGARVAVVWEKTGSAALGQAVWNDPWKSWGPPVQATSSDIPTYKLSTRFAAAHDNFDSVVVLHRLPGSGSCLGLTRTPLPLLEQITQIGDCNGSPNADHTARALVSGPPILDLETYLVGFDVASHQLSFARVALSWGTDTVTPSGVLGCATSEVFAGGWYSPSDGFIAAYTTSRPFNGCMTDLYADGPPTRLQIAAFGKSTESMKTELRHELTLAGPVMGLQVSPRADGGAWVVFQTYGSKAPGPIQAIAVDSKGKSSSPIVTLDAPVDLEDFALAPLGNRAMLFYYGYPAPPTCGQATCDQLRFKVFDENTTAATPPTHALSVAWPTVDRVSLVSSPDGKSVIAAWSDAKAMPSDVWAMRFDCAQ